MQYRVLNPIIESSGRQAVEYFASTIKVKVRVGLLLRYPSGEQTLGDKSVFRKQGMACGIEGKSNVAVSSCQEE